jgi:ABC-type transport system substrate-binding protein
MRASRTTVRRAFAAVAVAALVVTACAPAEDPEDDLPDPDVEETDEDPDAAPGEEDDDAPGDVADDETFRMAVGIDLDTFDPAAITTTTVGDILTYMVETLTVIDEEGQVHGHLATDWDISDDGLTYTLELAQDVQFHDGTPFNADAVVFTMERLKDPDVQVNIRAAFDMIDTVEALDEHSVEINLTQPFPPFMAAMSFHAGAIISPDSVEAEGNTYTDYTNPVGTGPYTFGEYTAGERFTMQRFDDYWGDLPYYSDVEFQIVPEAATRVSQLRAGDVHAILSPPISDLPALEEDANVEVLLAPGNRQIFLAINNNTVEDPRVRRAMNLAVDRDRIIENVLFGSADPVDAPMDPSLEGYCAVGEWEYDPDQARELLEEADAVGFEIDFIAPTGRYTQDFEVGQAVAGFLEEVGFDVTGPETMDWPSYIERITAEADDQQQDLHLLGWAPSYMDSFQHMVIFQTNQHPPNGLATSFYSNDEVDSILADASTEVDPDARQQLYCEASEILWEEAPFVFLYSQRFPIAYSSEITGVSYRPNEGFYMLDARPAS